MRRLLGKPLHYLSHCSLLFYHYFDKFVIGITCDDLFFYYLLGRLFCKLLHQLFVLFNQLGDKIVISRSLLRQHLLNARQQCCDSLVYHHSHIVHAYASAHISALRHALTAASSSAHHVHKHHLHILVTAGILRLPLSLFFCLLFFFVNFFGFFKLFFRFAPSALGYQHYHKACHCQAHKYARYRCPYAACQTKQACRSRIYRTLIFIRLLMRLLATSLIACSLG